MYWLSIISILGFLFDAIDGHVARKKGKTSQFGAFLDSTLDRISDFFLISAFGFGNLVSWKIVIFVLFSSFLISYMRARAESLFDNKKHFAEGFMQRTERIVFILTSFFIFLIFPRFQILTMSFLNLAFLFIFILNIITIFQRFLAHKSLSKL